MMKSLKLALALCAIPFFGAAAAVPSEPIPVGRAAVIENMVSARDATQIRRLKIEDILFFKDQLITADRAKTVVEFRDGSTLEMGPSAAITIDELVFNPAENVNSKSVTLLAGTFRYMSGYVAKDAKVQFKTGGATIGIRGCSFDAIVNPAQPAFFFMGNGSATVSNSQGTVTLNQGQAAAIVAGNAPSSNLPAAVVAQALQTLGKTLGANPPSLPAAPAGTASAMAHANTVPTATQVTASASVSAAAPPVVTSSGPSLPLLVGAANVGILTQPASAPLTPAQSNFVNSANSQIPNAQAIVTTTVQANTSANKANEASATQSIITGVGQASPNTITQVVKNAATANPALAATIAGTAASAVPQAAVQISAIAVGANPAAASQISASVSQAAPQAASQVTSAVAVSASAAQAVANAVASGNTTNLQATINAIVSSSPDQAANVVAAALTAASSAPSAEAPAAATAAAAAPASASVAAAVTTAVVAGATAASPANAGAVLAVVQSTVPASLQATAITATQMALAPAAGTPTAAPTPTVTAPGTNPINQTPATVVNQIQQTSEVPRRSTASPSS